MSDFNYYSQRFFCSLLPTMLNMHNGHVWCCWSQGSTHCRWNSWEQVMIRSSCKIGKSNGMGSSDLDSKEETVLIWVGQSPISCGESHWKGLVGMWLNL